MLMPIVASSILLILHTCYDFTYHALTFFRLCSPCGYVAIKRIELATVKLKQVLFF